MVNRLQNLYTFLTCTWYKSMDRVGVQLAWLITNSVKSASYRWLSSSSHAICLPKKVMKRLLLCIDDRSVFYFMMCLFIFSKEIQLSLVKWRQLHFIALIRFVRLCIAVSELFCWNSFWRKMAGLCINVVLIDMGSEEISWTLCSFFSFYTQRA